MTVVKLSHLLNEARAHGYALGYFEAWDQYSLETVVAVAEELNAPAIVGFGAAVTSRTWLDAGGVETLAGLARGLAERCRVPAAVLFNEAQTIEQIQRAIAAGCNAVMLDTSHLPWDENLRATREVVSRARAAGVEVEAELGHLPTAGGPAGAERPASHLTDPAQAGRFVAETGIDLLGVAIGNVHLLSNGQAALDLERLEAIHQATQVPLVLHGGTGIPASAIQPAIARGVAKINYGTRLKLEFLAGVRKAVAALPEPMNVHQFIGSRDDTDILVTGQRRMRALLIELTTLYGSAGRPN